MARIFVAIICILCAFFGGSGLAFSEQMATTEDGVKVILKDDGTWEYVKEETKIKANDPSVPFGIAEEYKSNYDFDKALEWYDRVIKDFPESLEAGNASLNRLVILDTESLWYATLSIDFLDLHNIQFNEATKYSYGGQVRAKLMLKADSLKKRSLKYLLLNLQWGKELREESYRFEKSYSSMMDKLSIPYMKKYSGETPPVIIMKESQKSQILLLGNENHLEYESRHKYRTNNMFTGGCIRYLILGGEGLTTENTFAYDNRELKTGINVVGFYYWLGLALLNAEQYKSAFLAYSKVIELSKDEPYSKLAYDATKRLDFIKTTARRMKTLSKLFPDNIEEMATYVEPYIEK